jgi:hypothetical protein
MLAIDEETGRLPTGPAQQQPPHTLEWHIASFSVPARRGVSHVGAAAAAATTGSKAAAGEDSNYCGAGLAPPTSSTGNATRTILKGLAGRAVGGELIAVMGPSGAFLCGGGGCGVLGLAIRSGLGPRGFGVWRGVIHICICICTSSDLTRSIRSSVV